MASGGAHTRDEPTGRGLRILAAGWIAFLWFPFVVLAAYAYPALDDYPESAWAGWWGWQRARYHDFTGRFVGSALQSLNPWHWHALGIYRASAVLRIGLFLAACVVCARAVNRTWLRASSTELAVLGALFFTCFLGALPAPAELFYWYSASVVYLLPLAVLLFATGTCLARPVPGDDGAPALLVAYAGFFFVAGNVEMLPACVLTAAATAAAVGVVRHRPWTRRCIVVAAVTLLGLAINLVAPGNRVRAEMMHVADRVVSLPTFAGEVAARALHAFTQWLADPYVVLPALLSLPVFHRVAARGSRAPHPALVVVGWFLVTCALYAAPLWGLGFVVGRVEALSLFVFLVGLFATLASLAARLAPWLDRVGWPLGGGRLFVMGWLAAAVALVVAHPPRRSPVERAYGELFTGKAARYARAEEARDAWMRRIRCRHPVAPPLGTIAKTLVPVIVDTELGADVLSSRPDGWWANAAFAMYYGRSSFRVGASGPSGACLDGVSGPLGEIE